MLALAAAKPIPIRNPDFTRPWQHVLDPLSGYLLLAASLDRARQTRDPAEIARYAQAFNFGPNPDSNRSVLELVEEILNHNPGTWQQVPQEKHLKEAPLLSLNIDKACDFLGWVPRWNFAQTVRHTMAWYKGYLAKESSMIDFTRDQIKTYCETIP
jgi:CDP-glucose 4,6-dehydratase